MLGLKAKTLVTLILIFLLISNICQAQKEDLLKKKYSPEQLKEDATLMKNVIIAMHPVIGIYESKNYYEKEFDNFITSLNDSLTEKQFRIKCKPMLEKLHCGHTDILYSNNYIKTVKKTKFNFPRYYLLPVDGKVFVLGGLNKKQDTVLKPGTEILKINGIAADSFYRYAKSLITIDGYIKESKQLYAQLWYSTYFSSMLNYPDTLTYEYVYKGKVKLFKSPSFKALNIPDYPLKKKDTLYTTFRKAQMKYKFLDKNKKTMHLSIAAFSHKRYKKSYRKIFRELHNNRSENLIIDLRYNGGGSLNNSYELLKYLLAKQENQSMQTHLKKYPFKKYTHGNTIFRISKWMFALYGKRIKHGDTSFYTMKINPRKKNHFNGKVYVLINGGSFSASCLVSAYLKETDRATFIGRETGGTIEGCNAVITPYYRLPNTRTKLRVPAYRLYHDVYKKGNNGRGIMLDHEINYSFKDLYAKKDLELEKAMELIK